MRKTALCLLLVLAVLLLAPLWASASALCEGRPSADGMGEAGLAYSEAGEPDPGIPLFQFSLGFLIPILLFGLAGLLGIGLLLALLVLIVRFFRRR